MINLRPSSSYMWTNCAAMPRFSEGLREQDAGDPAREGTCAAWVAECVLKQKVTINNVVYPVKEAADLIGCSHENGWLVETNMTDMVQDYVKHLKDRGGDIDVERKVTLNKMIEGTPDAFAVLYKTILIVDDLKFGYGVVEPYRNTQIAIYAGSILRKIMSKEVHISKVILGVYQPRAIHPDGIYRTWEVWPEQLMEFVRWIEERGEDCQDLTCNATPGPWCKHCPAAMSCVALAHTAYSAFQVLQDERQVFLDGEQLSRELDFLTIAEKTIAARLSAARTEASVRLKQSEYIPRWGFQEKFGKRKFNQEASVVKMMTGKDPYKKAELCTPAEMIRRGADEKTVMGMSSRPHIPPSLVRLDDDHYKRLFEGVGK